MTHHRDPWIADDATDRRKRADELLHQLVARLQWPAASRRLLAAPPPGAPRRNPRKVPAAPAGHRTGEGASSVLPYLTQSRPSKQHHG